MGFKHPFNDRFFDDNVFLTADKCIGKRAILTKEYIKKHNVDTCVLTFCKDIKNALKQYGDVVELDYVNSGEDQHTIYALDNVLFTIPFVGSACAAATIEEFVSLGIKKFLACGSAGLIDDNFDLLAYTLTSVPIGSFIGTIIAILINLYRRNNK